MQLKKLLIILMFPLLANVMIACCDCLETVIYHYTIDNLQLTSLDNSGSVPIEITTGSVPKRAYGIRVQLPTRVVAYNNVFQPLFVNSANAYSCGCPDENQFQPKDSIISIKIFTVNDFDAAHAAASEVSDYFKVFKRINFSYSSIEDFLAAGAPVYNDISKTSIDMDLLLIQAPALGVAHQFTMVITLSDNRVFTASTTPINFI